MKLNDFNTEAAIELQAILAFWQEHVVDTSNGGFLGKIDNDNTADKNALKGSVLNARILWSFSAVAVMYPDRGYHATASRAYHYIRRYFEDKKWGGVYWTVDAKGQPADKKKQIYAQAFTIYACSEYYEATKDETAKEFSIALYRLIEQHSYEPIYGGYLEAFSEEWKLSEDLRLSDKDANEKKTMNTHLHILEAYTTLYRIWPDVGLRQKIKVLLTVFAEKIIDKNSGHLRLFFNDVWEQKSDTVSYGHDIEASWLLLEAAHAIEDMRYIGEFEEISLHMAEATLEGIDNDGGLWYEYEPKQNHRIKEKHWWVQAEAVVGFLNAWQLSGHQKFLQTALANWSFIKNYIVDKQNGEWFWGLTTEYLVMNEDKAGLWKCPYHNSRCCIEVIRRTAALTY